MEGRVGRKRQTVEYRRGERGERGEKGRESKDEQGRGKNESRVGEERMNVCRIVRGERERSGRHDTHTQRER